MRKPAILLRALAVLVASTATRMACGCSGPEAEANIARAERAGWILFGIALLIAVSSGLLARLRHRRLHGGLWLAAVVAAHPAFWASARSGDCGRSRVEACVAATLLAGVLAGVLLYRAKRAAVRARSHPLR